MGHFLRNYPHQLKMLKSVIMILAFAGLFLPAHADVLNIPMKRTVATQSINTLEVVSVIKTLFNGRILSIRKKATYTNPDCHLVKFLEDKGELKFITVGCGMHTIAKSGL